MEYPDMKQYFLPDNKVKISAGWLIETMGYKGVKEGRVGTYDKHALVLVNHGGASGLEVWDFAQKIMDQAFHSFEIILEPEVLII
jgi:UDP-N-acetylmuramate dehydrogenase